MYVNEIMTTNPKTCRLDSSLDDVARLMWEGDCGAIPVVGQGNRPLGIITDRDIAMAAMLRRQPLWDIHAADVIQGQSLCCCKQSESIESCLQLMEEHEVRRMPVINDDSGALCGIVSLGDALAFTQGGSHSPKKKTPVDAADVIGTLKRVSAHHQSWTTQQPAM
jgi:CBS domain-containing protein